MLRSITQTVLGKRLLIVLGSVIAVDQFLLYTVFSDGVVFAQAIAPYEHALFTEHQQHVLEVFEDSLREDRARFDKRSQFDADLGWGPRPGEKRGRAESDWAGSRLGTSALPRGGDDRLVALVGCSYTFGTEVKGDETWARHLDVKWPGTRIGNFGVGGYGVDQACLRYRRDVAPLSPDEVWLGFYPDSALRVTSQFPPLYYPLRTRTIYFKPRFSLDEYGRLTLHPSPARRPEDIVRLMKDPVAFRDALSENDPWLARAPVAYLESGAHWSHYSAFARIFLTTHERGGRDTSVLLRDESSELFLLNRAIMLQLAQEVNAAGSRFRILILPGKSEVTSFERDGRGYWEPLVDSLREHGIEVLDLTGPLVEAGLNDDPAFWMRGGHHSPRTHQMIVEIIAHEWGNQAVVTGAGS